MANRYHLWVRLVGEPTLPPTQQLVSLLGVEPTTDWRRGGPLLGKPVQGHKSPMSLNGWEALQEVDVWTVELIDQWKNNPDPAVLSKAAALLKRMEPGLATLDRTRCRAQLYASATCFDEMGSIELPTSLVTAAGAARLELVVSIFCAIYDGEEGD